MIIKFVITVIDAFRKLSAPDDMEFPIFFNISVDMEDIDFCNTPKSTSNFEDISVITAEMLLKNKTI